MAADPDESVAAVNAITALAVAKRKKFKICLPLEFGRETTNKGSMA